MMRMDSIRAAVAPPGRHVVTNASRKGDESRLRILEAALIEFGAGGYRSTTTRSIADRAKTTLPPLNYYFGSKEGLYRACAEEIVLRYSEITNDAVSGATQIIQSVSSPETARSALKTLVAASVRLIIGSPVFILGNGIIARELSEPGPAFDIFYEQLWLPGIERNAKLISRIKGEVDVSAESRLQSILLISSLPSFHARRRVAQKAMQWSGIGESELNLLIEVLHRQIDQI